MENSYFQIEFSKKSFLNPLIFYTATIIYLEFVFHVIVYGSIDYKIIYPILFALPLALLFTIISSLAEEKVNKIIMWVLTGLVSFVFAFQLLYFDFFKVLFSFQTMGMVGDAISEFYKSGLGVIKNNILTIILVSIPMIVLYNVQDDFFDFKKREIKSQGILLGGIIVSHIFAVVTLLLFGQGHYSPYDLYHNNRVPELTGMRLGLVTHTRFDIEGLLKIGDELVLADTSEEVWNVTPTKPPEPTIAPKPTKTPEAEATPVPTVTPTPTPIPIDTSPNVMDIDFAKLAENESNKTIKTLHNYFASAKATNRNEFTGMFEGYNLILITAEGFAPYAVHKEKTPTLYKLVNSGFVFNNFYTPLWQTSTSDGEFVVLNGLIPLGTRSMYYSRNNYFPFSLGHQFNSLGIQSKAYHNHTYTYYERDQTHPNLGYDFVAIGNGLVLETDSWPRSDLEMINNTVDDYVDDDSFHVYYLTVSGHANYTFAGNSMSNKNRDLVKDLPYSSDARAYLACQIELDMALEALIERLEQAEVADKTVIALSADHYPYGWEKEYIDELSGYELEEEFEIFKNHFILWNPAMEEKILVNKPASSLDILPTLLNLFGFEYDSRLLMGQDILSDSDPLVIFNDRSFITDKVMYNTKNKQIIKLTDEDLPDNYINNINNIIKNKFSVSKSIIQEDYYSYIMGQGVGSFVP